MQRCIIIFALMLLSATLFAQDDTAQGKNVIIHKDPRIDLLSKKQVEINTAYQKVMQRTSIGYRIQVISTNDRELAMKLRTGLLQKFPEQKNYLIFQAPYVKLRFGNFRTKEEAAPYMKKIGKMVGTPLTLVQERIEREGK
jgi:hypothetical protein